MWTCHLCNRSFSRTNQNHFCGADSIGDFLNGKNLEMIGLFYAFVDQCLTIGPINLARTKTLIVVENKTHKFAYILKTGKTFIDIVFSFDKPYYNNLCFRKIAQVPGTNDYNHHLRLMHFGDLNKEVVSFIRKAYAN